MRSSSPIQENISFLGVNTEPKLLGLTPGLMLFSKTMCFPHATNSHCGDEGQGQINFNLTTNQSLHLVMSCYVSQN